MRALIACLVGVIVIVTPLPVSAWAMDVHRFLTRRAIDGLPTEIRPFFVADRDFIAEHSVDPDLWRVVNLKGDLGAEDPNHFLDIDGLDEPAPFAKVPREWAEFVKRYGEERAHRMGRLPWRTDEIYKLLVQRFQEIPKGTGYAADNVKYLVAVLAHYLEDAHQPLHATLNYDGQLTGQRGVHARFEGELVRRNLSTLKLPAVQVQPVPNVRDFMFDTLVESQSLVATVLAADGKAVAGREQVYDDAYFAQFLTGVRPVLERRLGESASAVASVVVAAWTQAGKPALPLKPTARIR